jgi:hypothetical protein
MDGRRRFGANCFESGIEKRQSVAAKSGPTPMGDLVCGQVIEVVSDGGVRFPFVGQP